MYDIRPLDRFLDDGEVGTCELISMGLDEAVEDGNVEIGQDVVRLGRLRLVVAAGQYTDLLPRLAGFS